MTKYKHQTFRLPVELYEKLDKIADKRGCNLSEVIRDLIERQLNIETLKADEDMIREYIRAEIENIVEPYLKRIIAINSRSAIASASAWILAGRVFENFVPPHMQEEYHEAMDESHRGGYAFVSVKDIKLQDLIDGTWVSK